MENPCEETFFQELIESARYFASHAHSKQTRDDGVTPYFTHVRDVAEKVKEYTDDAEVIAAAYLHDTMEDCGTTKEELTRCFGSRVADLVEFLTNATIKENERSQDAASRRKADNVRIAAAPTDVWLIKLCDRLHNLSSINNWDKKRVVKYIEKTQDLLSVIFDECIKRFEANLVPYWLPALNNQIVGKVDELKERNGIR